MSDVLLTPEEAVSAYGRIVSASTGCIHTSRTDHAKDCGDVATDQLAKVARVLDGLIAEAEALIETSAGFKLDMAVGRRNGLRAARAALGDPAAKEET